ncbi:hypothetical protein EVAR_81542_1 [Eumeta japonica]|uniref:Uncharacterized protein n=1 Tax=Eumeta variegata TaxID=151549 RepID=A0A4C1V0K9_EUMVA|nr:hypothetical protein EVAR_81542_1 [Eumeta japonica]
MCFRRHKVGINFHSRNDEYDIFDLFISLSFFDWSSGPSPRVALDDDLYTNSYQNFRLQQSFSGEVRNFLVLERAEFRAQSFKEEQLRRHARPHIKIYTRGSGANGTRLLRQFTSRAISGPGERARPARLMDAPHLHPTLPLPTRPPIDASATCLIS